MYMIQQVWLWNNKNSASLTKEKWDIHSIIFLRLGRRRHLAIKHNAGLKHMNKNGKYAGI